MRALRKLLFSARTVPEQRSGLAWLTQLLVRCYERERLSSTAAGGAGGSNGSGQSTPPLADVSPKVLQADVEALLRVLLERSENDETGGRLYLTAVARLVQALRARIRPHANWDKTVVLLSVVNKHFQAFVQARQASAVARRESAPNVMLMLDTIFDLISIRRRHSVLGTGGTDYDSFINGEVSIFFSLFSMPF